MEQDGSPPASEARRDDSVRTRLSRAGLGLALGLAALTGCTNAPPPPVVTTPVAESSPAPEETASQIVVGVNDISGGYNPHNIADGSTVTSALSQLLLPSVFRPEDDGSLALDETLMVSAEVTSRSPFTVAYEIRPDASWSDGAPIAAEDFIYLADAMRTEPGVVQPAGYRLISGIESREGGKRVEVTFAEAYPGWRTLFDNLLPAHLLKDAPGGWRGALAESFPAYGGPFSIKTLDKGRGEIILERNERYWEKPAAVDRLVLRSADQAGMAAALRSGNDQFAIARTDATGLNLFGELGQEIDLHRIARPRTASLLLRPVGALTDDQVRAGIAALIDRTKLIEEGIDGGPSATLRADAQVTPPSDPAYTPTLPTGDDGAPIAEANSTEAERLLTAAGYEREAGTWSRDGETLSVVLAAPREERPYTTIAQELQRQLVAAGVEVRLVTPPARELFASQLAMPVESGQGNATNTGNVGVDIAVVPQPTGGDPASTLASLFGCGLDREEQTENAPDMPANPAAFCVESLQPSIEAALTGATEPAEALAELEPELWRQNVVIPLFQLADTLAVGDGVIGVAPGPPLAGPFGAAVNWTRGAK